MKAIFSVCGMGIYSVERPAVNDRSKKQRPVNGADRASRIDPASFYSRGVYALAGLDDQNDQS